MQTLLNLDTAQTRAVTSESKVILDLAGAGSGKTRVLVHRIANLVNNRVGTSNMLALTFTRLAGREMKERLIPLIGEDNVKNLFCGTFHSFCVKVLREWGSKIGVEPTFSIYDEDDRRQVIENIIHDFKYKTKSDEVINHFVKKWDKAMLGDAGKVIAEYQYQLKQNNALDLDMLLRKTIELLDIEEVRSYYHNLYRYVFVDEYQDTSDHQMAIIKKLNPDHLFVVGDDFQAIYGWRGANVQNILYFTLHFPDAEIIKQENNYRSTRQIVEAANNLISYNTEQTDKKLIALREGPPVEVNEYETEFEEARAILKKIKELKIEDYSQVAILARTNSQLYNIKNIIGREIPCQLVNNQGDPFKKPGVAEIISFIRAASNLLDNNAVKKVINLPTPRLTKLQLEKLELEAMYNDVPLFDLLENSNDYHIKKFVQQISRVKDYFENECSDAEKVYLETAKILGWSEYLKEHNQGNRLEQFEDAHQRIAQWQVVQKELNEDYSIRTFLRYLCTRDIQEKLLQEKVNAVKLLTVHAAKGLEFPVVFLVGMNQGVFPNRKSDIEEERRLAYVAITRAKDRLYISRARQRISKNGYEQIMEPSQFLEEIKKPVNVNKELTTAV